MTFRETQADYAVCHGAPTEATATQGYCYEDAIASLVASTKNTVGAVAALARVRALIDDPQVLDDWIAISKVRAALAEPTP